MVAAKCVNLTREICSIFKNKKLPFCCPECIVSKLPGSRNQKTSTDSFGKVCNNSESEETSDSAVVLNERESALPESEEGASVQSIEDINSKKSKNLVIIDGIINPSEFQNSRDIQREIRKHKGDIQMKYAYPLNRGGIAIHVETEEELQVLKEDWPADAFSSNSGISVHENGLIPRCVFKNVPAIQSSEVIELETKKQTGLSVSVRRLRYRDSGRCMPIVIVTCKSHGELVSLLKSKIIINKKAVKIVPYQSKRYTPTRCFNCQEYGHIAKLCKKEEKCEKCAESHTGKCTSSYRCINCGSGHPSSSLSCPTFLAIKERLLRRRP